MSTIFLACRTPSELYMPKRNIRMPVHCQNASTLRLEYKSSDCPSCQDITVGMKEGLQHIAHYGTGQSE